MSIKHLTIGDIRKMTDQDIEKYPPETQVELLAMRKNIRAMFSDLQGDGQVQGS